MLPRRPAALLLALAGPVALLTGCSEGDPLGVDYSVEDALEALPAVTDEELLVVRTADLTAATDLAGSDPDDEEWLRDVALGGPVYVPFPASYVRFGPDAGVQPQDAASFTSLQAGGDGLVEVYRWRDGEPPSDSDDAGGLVRASEDDDTVVLASDDAWLDRWRDRDDTMADDEHLGALAEALDDQSVYAAELFANPTDRGPVRAYGVGQDVDGDRAVEYAVFSLDDDADVAQVADEIEDAWEATGTVQRGDLEVDDVDTDGRVVVVRLLADTGGTTSQTLIQRLEFQLPE